jgi:tetratricopeptide (TPR) repeat protein
MTLFLPAGAGAEEPQAHALRIRFAEGRALQEVGRWADALPHFEEIARARPTAHVTFHIALCLDRLGRLRNAERVYLAAIAAAGRSAPDVAADAQEHLADLGARMPRVLVTLTGATEGVTLLLDGEPVSRAALSRTDPGPHTVVAMRGGIPVAAIAFSVLERRTKLLRLQIYP